MRFGNFWRALDTFWWDGNFSIRPNPFDHLVFVFSASMISPGIWAESLQYYFSKLVIEYTSCINKCSQIRISNVSNNKMLMNIATCMFIRISLGLEPF